MWYTYILLCKDKTLYTGITNDLKKRLRDHKLGKGSKYTRSHGANKIIYFEAKRTKAAALKKEILIKKMKRSVKLELVLTNSLK